MKKDYDFVRMEDYRKDTREIVESSIIATAALKKELYIWKRLFTIAILDRSELFKISIYDLHRPPSDEEELIIWNYMDGDTMSFEIRKKVDAEKAHEEASTP